MTHKPVINLDNKTSTPTYLQLVELSPFEDYIFAHGTKIGHQEERIWLEQLLWQKQEKKFAGEVDGKTNLNELHSPNWLIKTCLYT